jgi:opacity protein-like surface antigen
MNLLRMIKNLVFVLLLGLAITQVWAADFEFIPFVGHRFGGSLEDVNSFETRDLDSAYNWGFIVGHYAGDTTRYELLYSHQDTKLADSTDPNDAFDLEVHYLHLGGTVDISQNRFIPYFSGGLGMTHLNPVGYGFDEETRFSLSLGGGLKWYPTDSLGLRFEVRGYGTVSDGSGSLFCSSGDCNLRFKGDLMSQFETNLGLILRF